MGLGSMIYENKETKQRITHFNWIDKHQSEFTNYEDADKYFHEHFESTGLRESGGYPSSPADRQRAAVYATGNKWAIENWNATHN